MIQEVQDLYGLLEAVHASVDRMLDGLTPEQWLQKPRPDSNNIASVIDHVVRVERKFLSAVAGKVEPIDAGEPFRVQEWDLDAIRGAWAGSLSYARQALADVREESLSADDELELGVGKLNKRQLISYAIAHTSHHRGQIPLIKKWLDTSH